MTVLERTNVRDLGPGDLAEPPDLVVADLSFISLRLAIPALARCAAPRADVVLLVKPQFEAGRAEVGRGGVVADPAVWERVLRSVAEACVEAGFEVLAVGPSSLLGPAGNVEFLLHARGDPGRPCAHHFAPSVGPIIFSRSCPRRGPRASIDTTLPSRSTRIASGMPKTP